MASSTQKNFSLLNTRSQIIAVTSTSQRIRLERKADDIMLVNDSALTIFVRCGNKDVLADANAMPILAGEKGVYDKGGNIATHLAFFLPAGMASITVMQGRGV